MRYLKIKDPGLFIHLSGAAPTRTPAEIDITNCDLNTVLIELRSYGIDNFQILNKADLPKDIKKRQVDTHNTERSTLKYLDKKYISTGKKQRNVGMDNSKLGTKFDRIEKLLEELVSLEKQKSKQVTKEKDKNFVKSSKKQDDDNEPEVEDFIPDIDFSGLKINNPK